MTTTCQQIKVRACSITCIQHPEWGTWGVMEDRGTHFEILGRAGRRVLDKWEADRFWRVEPPPTIPTLTPPPSHFLPPGP